jgi:hypothetical protein
MIELQAAIKRKATKKMTKANLHPRSVKVSSALARKTTTLPVKRKAQVVAKMAVSTRTSSKTATPTRRVPSPSPQPPALTPEDLATPTTATKLGQAAPPTATKRFGLIADVSYGANLVNHKDGTDSRLVDYEFWPSLMITENYKTSLRLIVEQDLNGDADTDFVKSSISFSHKPMVITPAWKWVPAVSFGLPLSKADRDASLQGSVAAAITTSFSNKGSSFLPGLGTDLAFLGAKSIHTYKTNADGDPNTEYVLEQTIVPGYDITDELNFNLTFDHVSSWNYLGVISEKYGISEELDYTVGSIMVGAGHTNAGSALRPDARAYDVRLYNENSSVGYVVLKYAY